MTESCEIRSTLEAILAEQISRLITTANLTEHQTDEIMKTLKDARLLPDLIERDLCKELKSVCSIRFDSPNASSTRFSGLGWSLPHINLHMKRLLTKKMAAVSTILRSHNSAVSLMSIV